MAGRSDAPHYGQLLVYTFPKGVEVFCPRQFEALIDQNTAMSQALTLWGQRGSEVIRGNLLTIPLFPQGSMQLLFAEPIRAEAAPAPPEQAVGAGEALADMVQRARAALTDFRTLMGRGEYEEAGRRLSELNGLLEEILDRLVP
jgi:uncharacterized membrane protein (UPF0182 family)